MYADVQDTLKNARRPDGSRSPHRRERTTRDAMLSPRDMIEAIWRKSPWAPLDGADFGLAYALKFDPELQLFAEIIIGMMAMQYFRSFRKIGGDEFAPAYPNGLDAENVLDGLLRNEPMKLAIPDELFPNIEPMGEAEGAIYFQASDVNDFRFDADTVQHVRDRLNILPSLTKLTVASVSVMSDANDGRQNTDALTDRGGPPRTHDFLAYMAAIKLTTWTGDKDAEFFKSLKKDYVATTGQQVTLKTVERKIQPLWNSWRKHGDLRDFTPASSLKAL